MPTRNPRGANKRKAPTLSEVGTPPVLEALTDDELSELAAQTSAEDVCRWLLARDPKLSGRQLCAVAIAVGHETTMVACKRYREQWAADGRPREPVRYEGVAPGVAPDDEPELAPAGKLGDVLADLQMALREGDPRKALQYAQVAKALGVDLGGGADAAPEGFDATRLSDAELACYRALESVACGRVPARGSDAEWFIALLRRVPPRETRPHPAHLPLPAGAPLGVELVVPA